MLDHALENAFCNALKAVPKLADLHFFTGQTDECHELPALTVISTSESLTGSAEVFRADVQIVLESHAHDTSPQQHSAILGQLRSILSDKPSLLAAVNANGAVVLFGYALVNSEPEAVDGKFRTVLTLKAGYRVPPN
jgi:hypothetical protein